MLTGYSPQNIAQWRQGLYHYQKTKRTKKPFGESVPPPPLITAKQHRQVYATEDPILQKSVSSEAREHKEQRREQLKQYNSMLIYERNHGPFRKQYDIINLHSQRDAQPHQRLRIKSQRPVRNLYNIINNTKLPQFHLQKAAIKLPKEDHGRKKVPSQSPDFDILTGNSDEQQMQRETLVRNQIIREKLAKSHVYDPVYSRFYKEDRQAEELQRMREKEIIETQKKKKLPYSYENRECYVQGTPQHLPQMLQDYDRKQQKSKERYKLKYIIEKEYSRRNDEEFTRDSLLIRNKANSYKSAKSPFREFDMISNRDQHRQEPNPEKSIESIKSRGFQ